MTQTGKDDKSMKKNSEKKNRRGIVYALIFIILATVIITAGFLFYRKYESDFRSESERTLTAIVEQKVIELANWRRGRLNDALLFFQNGVFSVLVRRYFENPADVKAQIEIRTWLSHLRRARQYDRLMLLDDSFFKKISIPATEERDNSFVSPSSAADLRAGKVAFEDFYWNEPNKKIYIKILVPVLEGYNNNLPKAILAMRIDPEDYLFPLITRWPTPSRTAETLLVRRDGNDILYLNELRFQKNTALKLRIPLRNKEVPAVMAVLGREGIMEGPDYRGVPVIAVMRSIPASPWFLVARIDKAEVFAPLAERLRLIIILILVLLLGAGAGLALLWRRRQIYFFKAQAEAAQALLESQANLSAITNAAQDAILMMDNKGRLTYWNPSAERIFGYSESEALGNNLHELIAPQRYHPAHHAAFPEFLRTGRGTAVGQTLELQALQKDGSEITVALSLSAVQIKGNWHAVGILRDISKQKAAEKELYNLLDELEQTNQRLEAANERANQLAVEAQAANIAKSQFLANMSHEIRTPMNGVIGMIGLLLGTDLSDGAAPLRRNGASSGEALLGVINDILDFSKIEADKLELETLDFDLRATLEDAAELLAVRAHEKGLEFICRIDPEVPTFLRGDPGRLRQILINLGGNAIKFTARGEVAIEVRLESESDDRIEVRVRGARHGHRHSRGQDRPAVQRLPAGGRLDHAPVRRHRAGAGHLQAPGRS